MSPVAALYVDPKGPYPNLTPYWYDEERDARTYAGPFPVVAHPPCGPWGKLRHLCKYQDPVLALRAVEQVRQAGGVLEHPEFSRLWDACGLPRPGEAPDAFGGITLAVEQVHWGHVARKRTWVYVSDWRRLRIPWWPTPKKAVAWISGTYTAKKRGLVPVGIRVASALEARLTPPAFASWLLEIASRLGRQSC